MRAIRVNNGARLNCVSPTVYNGSRRYFPACRRADGQWPPLRQHRFITPHCCRGEHRSSAAAAGELSALRMASIYIASARLYLAEVFGNCHFLNDRAAKNTGRRGGHWPSARENLQRCETARECKKDYCRYLLSGAYLDCSNVLSQDDIFLYTILIIYLLKNGYNFAIIYII